MKPILKRITGQKKVTQQIEDVLERVEETAPERFELLENWMTEEQAIDMTPNHVFLDAMQKVLTRRAARIEQENNVRLEEIEEKLHDSGISISEKKALDKEREDIRKETADAKMRSKRVRRGKEHTSHEDRDNVNGGFFSLRNPTTKQYKDALNELTERRKEVLVAEKSDDIEKKITARDEYEKYLLDNSKAKHVRRMPFNAKEGVVGIASRDVSDRKDNRVRNATYIAVGLAAAVNSIMEMLKLENAQQQASDIANQNAKYLEDARNQINKIQQEAQANGDSLTQKQIQQVLNKEVMDKANAAEVSIMRGNGGSLIGSQYRAGDEALNIDVQNGVDTVHSTSQTISNLGGSDKLFGTVRKLLEMKQSGLSTEEALSRASNGQLLGGYSVDHAAQAELFAGNQNAQYGNAEMDLLRKLLDTAESASKVNIPQGSKVGKISANFIGAITSACLPIIRAIKDHTRKDKVETKVDNESKDKEENNEHYENERN